LDQIQDGGWPPSWKISNGHISATDHPIDFVFDTRVRFSGTADRMVLFPISPSWEISNGYISGTGRPIDFVFDPVGDGGSNFRLYQIQDSPARHLGKFRMTISLE